MALLFYMRNPLPRLFIYLAIDHLAGKSYSKLTLRHLESKAETFELLSAIFRLCIVLYTLSLGFEFNEFNYEGYGIENGKTMLANDCTFLQKKHVPSPGPGWAMSFQHISAADTKRYSVSRPSTVLMQLFQNIEASVAKATTIINDAARRCI